MADLPYSRVYWTIVDDEKFATIYDSNDHLATWLRLLLIADQANPASAHVPVGTSSKSLKALVACGLVDLSGGRYRIHGLSAERERRAERGRNAANARWNATASNGAMRPHMPSDARRDETSLDELRQDETSNARDEPYIEAWLMAKHRLPTVRQREFMDRYLQVFDVTGPQRMAELILRHPDDPIAALKADLDAHREERLGEIADWKPTPRQLDALITKPKPKREPWQEMFRASVEAQEAAIPDPMAAAPKVES